MRGSVFRRRRRLGGVGIPTTDGVNLIAQSYDLTTTWTTSNASAAKNAVGLFGAANTASTLTDASAAAFGILQFAEAALLGPVSPSTTYAYTVFFKKDSAATTYPEIQISSNWVDGGGNAVVQINLSTGQTNNVGPGTVGTIAVTPVGNWWRLVVPFTIKAVPAAGFMRILPASASGTWPGTRAASVQGACIVGHAQLELGAVFTAVDVNPDP